MSTTFKFSIRATRPALFGALTFIVFATVACSSASAPPSFPERSFAAPWSMSATDVERLRTRVNAVNLGDTIGHVVENVGVPDLDQTFKKNQRHRILTYYVTRQRADASLESDKVAVISFDHRERVEGVYSNVENIATRNWPGHPNSTK